MSDPTTQTGSVPDGLTVSIEQYDEARREIARLRQRVHDAVAETQRRYAHYQARCDRFDVWAQWARESCGQDPRNTEHSWWSMTSEAARLFVVSLIEERDGLLAEVKSLREAGHDR